MSSPEELTVKVKVSLCSNDEDEHVGVLGKGTATLLRGIKELGSLNKIAHELHMAYSKAWRILRDTEEGFGFKLVERDGARGSSLTLEGERILAAYDAVCAEVEAYAQRRYLEELSK